jgi:hypothetical protein
MRKELKFYKIIPLKTKMVMETVKMKVKKIKHKYMI